MGAPIVNTTENPMPEDKQIEEFATWLRGFTFSRWHDKAAHEAARRFGMSPEDAAVIEAAEKIRQVHNLEPDRYSNREFRLSCDPSLLVALLESVDARRKAQEPKPRYEAFEFGIRDRQTSEYVSMLDGAGRERLLALLNQAHETERG